MTNIFYTRQHWAVFSGDLVEAFIKSGFEVEDEPYIDDSLCGFRATFVRRYQFHQPIPFFDTMLTTIVHVVGLPFGRNSRKMVVMSAPRNTKNIPVAETLKLRLIFDDNGVCRVMQPNQSQSASSDQQHGSRRESAKTPKHDASLDQALVSEHQVQTSRHQDIISFIEDQSEHLRELASSLLSHFMPQTFSERTDNVQLAKDFAGYVAHIVELISPNLIHLPVDMKLEVLKRLSVDSIIKMSQVNDEFRILIFQRGESLWRHLCYRDFSVKFINRLIYRSWMELYRDLYIAEQIALCRKERALPGVPERPALPPVPYRLQIEWLPEVLQLPFYPLEEELEVHHDNLLPIALGLPLRRSESLDSL